MPHCIFQVLQRQKSEREAKKRAVQLMKMEMEQSSNHQPRNLQSSNQEPSSSSWSSNHQLRKVSLTNQEPPSLSLANQQLMSASSEHMIGQYGVQSTNHSASNGQTLTMSSYNAATNGSNGFSTSLPGAPVNGRARESSSREQQWEEEEERERVRTRQAAIRVQEEQRTILGRLRGARRPDDR